MYSTNQPPYFFVYLHSVLSDVEDVASLISDPAPEEDVRVQVDRGPTSTKCQLGWKVDRGIYFAKYYG